MTFPNRHWLFTAFGTSWGGVEEFSFGFRINNTDPPVQADVDALVSATQTFWNTAGMGIDSQHSLIGIKLAPIGTNGLYPPGEDAVEALITPDPGPGAGGNHWAPQCTMCVTTTTAVPRGLAAMGRFYLPSMTGAISAAGRAPSGLNTSIASATQTWFNAINTATLGAISVFSKGNAATPGGAVHSVTGVRVGDVIDTQRRRRRQLVESYATATVTP